MRRSWVLAGSRKSTGLSGRATGRSTWRGSWSRSAGWSKVCLRCRSSVTLSSRHSMAGSLARIVEAAAAERPPILPSVKVEPGFPLRAGVRQPVRRTRVLRTARPSHPRRRDRYRPAAWRTAAVRQPRPRTRPTRNTPTWRATSARLRVSPPGGRPTEAARPRPDSIRYAREAVASVSG